MQLDFGQLAAFKSAVDEGTFEAAARSLHVTPSAISQRIKALEKSVGRVLLQRTKPVRVTESGLELLLLTRQIETLTAHVASRLSGEVQTRASLAIAVNADSLATWVMPAVAEVTEAATVEVFREDQEHTIRLLREGRVMAAVTSQSEPVPGCLSVRLGAMRYSPMASPEFAARWFPDGCTPDELSVAPVVMFDRKDDLQDKYLRRRVRRRIDPPRSYIPSSADYAAAVRNGIGWGMVPELQIDEGAGDELVHLDRERFIDTPLYWQQWRLSSELLDAAATAFRSHARRVLR